MTLAPFPPSPGLMERLGWPRLLSLANLLVAGATLLLVPQLVSVYVLNGPDLRWLLFLSLLVAGLGAWPVMFAAALSFADAEGDASPAYRISGVAVILLGIFGFVAGMATLPLAFPAPEYGLFFNREWEFVLFYALFPYVPTVFAPVVFSHAALAALAGAGCRDDRARLRLQVGAYLLAAVSTVALLIQVEGLLDGWAWSAVWFTFPGYLLIFVGAGREARARATLALSPGPGSPSRGLWP